MDSAYTSPDSAESPALPDWHGPGHPILMGLTVVALAVAAWHGLLWRAEHPVEDLSTGQISAQASDSVVADSPVATASAGVASGPEAPVPTRATAPTPPPPAGAAASATSVVDTSAGAALSPFRRSHPWAAVPGQPYYYPSRCPATLRFDDLVFYRTQAQARADGYVPAPDSGCG